jgi:hypothetical protein
MEMSFAFCFLLLWAFQQDGRKDGKAVFGAFNNTTAMASYLSEKRKTK